MLAWWLLALTILAGHFGLFLALYNRVNACGIPRRLIKTLEVVLLVACLGIATVLMASFASWLLADTPPSLASLPPLLAGYAILAIGALIYYGVPWLIYRPIFGREWVRLEKTNYVIDVPVEMGALPAATAKCRLHSRVPFNQIFELAVEHKELPVPGLPNALHGLKVAHLSDVHLTGHVSPAFYRIVSESVMRWQPDLVVLTGDLIDKAACIEWLPECFESINAPQGCYFILGNHDTIVKEPQQTRRKMESLGWIDLGGTSTDITINGCRVTLLGSEVPWFGAPPIVKSDGAFPMLLSHSPDQIMWARDHGIPLMFAGHTHGGQGRLPLIGPLLSPSRFGSRFASGEFYLEPTTMHVTRGLSGTHLMRIRCRPEVSLLTLQQPETSQSEAN